MAAALPPILRGTQGSTIYSTFPEFYQEVRKSVNQGKGKILSASWMGANEKRIGMGGAIEVSPKKTLKDHMQLFFKDLERFFKEFTQAHGQNSLHSLLTTIEILPSNSNAAISLACHTKTLEATAIAVAVITRQAAALRNTSVAVETPAASAPAAGAAGAGAAAASSGAAGAGAAAASSGAAKKQVDVDLTVASDED